MSSKTISSAVILHPQDCRQHERGGGIRTTPLVNAPMGSRQTLSGITEIDPGMAVPKHFHNCEETVLVLSGAGVAEIDGIEHPVKPNDLSWIPAGIHHFFRNTSADEKLRIYWTYASLDADRTIVATGVTKRIDEEHGVAPGK